MRKILSVLFWIGIICVAIVLLTEILIYIGAAQSSSLANQYELRLVQGATPKFTTKDLSVLYSSIKLLYIPVFIILVFFIVERVNLHEEERQEKKKRKTKRRNS